MRSIYILLSYMLLTITATCQPTIKACTFNIRNSAANDGINSWDNRKQLAAKFITDEKPDIVGMQEVLQNQLSYLNDELKDYASLGAARDDGKQKGEYSPIFYRKDRFDLVRTETIWLSETPHSIGSKGWDAALPRVATIAILKDKLAKQELMVVCTHLDHMGKVARKESTLLIKKVVEEQQPKHYIVMGDFNSLPSEEPYLTAVKAEVTSLRLIDAQTTATKKGKVESKGYTFNDYGKITSNCTIDYIFSGTTLEAQSYAVKEIKEGATYISDHFPVVVVLKYQ